MHLQHTERILSGRNCSPSGQRSGAAWQAPQGACAGSKRSMAAAARRREALYQTALKVQQEGQSQTLKPPRAAKDSGETSRLSRRSLLSFGSSAALATLAAQSCEAVSLPQAVDNAWSAVGGGPPDLIFPDHFLGHWLTESTLSKIETPLGLEFIPNPLVVERARREDLQKQIRYEVSYIKNKKGKVIIDRRFNTASLMNLYLGQGAVEEQGVSWNPDDPNRLSFQLPGGTNIVTRVVRRSEENLPADRINTSEFFEQVFQVPDKVEPKVKASQCFTKYKWRSPQEAVQTGGPLIVATQVVSDYLTPYDGEALMLRARNRPTVVYTYNMSFRRVYKSYEA